MAFSTDEIQRLKDRIYVALTSGHLNPWETRFLTDIKTRIETYGTKTRFSEKQLSKLYQIMGPEKRVGQAIQMQPRRTARRRPAWQPRRKRSLLGREGRRLANRFVRDFAIIAALAVVVVLYSLSQRGSLPVDIPFASLQKSITSISRNSTTSITRGDFTVTDGDTIRLRGDRRGTRLVGFNTPETYEPRCQRGLEFGRRATARLKELVAAANLTLEKVACACKPGTQGTEACNYGRSCGILRVDGRDVGQILISEGLAAPFRCGATSCPPTPRPWCN